MSLFAGVGGFDLAAEWMGWETTVQVELDEWCRSVLAKNFPNAIQYADIKEFDGTAFRGSIDLICGGFPCQPVSLAGRRKGKKDDRFLWPQMLRVVREVAPRWVVGENVSGLLSQDAGLVFESVLTDLEAEGYTVWPYLLPACGVNAPHRRERVFIIAYRNDRLSKSAIKQLSAGRQAVEFGCNGAHANAHRIGCDSGNESTRWQAGSNVSGCGTGSALANAHRDGEQQPERTYTKIGGRSNDSNQIDATHTRCLRCQRWVHGSQSGPRQTDERRNGDPSEHFTNWPTQPPLCARNDGLPAELVRPGPRKSKRTFSPHYRAYARWRARVIKASGNAIVPQVAYQIFKAIQSVNNSL